MKSPEMQQFIDKVSTKLYGKSVTHSRATGLCISCKQPALPKCYSDAGRREFGISGLCEECFDNICGKEEE